MDTKDFYVNGNLTISGILNINGGTINSLIIVTNSTTLSTYNYVAINANNIVVTLPTAPLYGQTITIFDITGDLLPNITISGNINNTAGSILNTSYMSLSLICYNTTSAKWNII